MDAAREEEAAGSWPHTTLQQRPDLAPLSEAAVTGEEGVLLPVHPSGADLDDRHPEVLVIHHRMDISPDN